MTYVKYYNCIVYDITIYLHYFDTNILFNLFKWIINWKIYKRILHHYFPVHLKNEVHYKLMYLLISQLLFLFMRSAPYKDIFT